MATAWEEIVRFLLCGSFIHPIFLFGFCSDSYEVQVSALIHIFDSTSRRCSHCISGHRHLRSADRGHLNFPHVKLASYGGRSFAYAGPSNWNSLPAHLRDNSLSLSSFRRHRETFLFSFYWASTRSAFGVLLQKRAI